MTQHTPTPWIATSDCHYDAASYLIETQDGKLVIATCHEGDADEVLDCSANAAHIVKCVNSHDALVEALKGVIRVADRATVEFDAAKAALKLAGEA
jgi:hypothetical protein